jgi:hypothetical protein
MVQGGLYKASAAVTDRKKGTQAGLFKRTVPRNSSIYYFNFFSFLMYFFQHCFSCRPSDFTVSEDGIEAVAALALAVRRSLTTRLDLIFHCFIPLEVLKFCSRILSELSLLGDAFPWHCLFKEPTWGRAGAPHAMLLTDRTEYIGGYSLTAAALGLYSADHSR